ncbi:proteasome subunit beta type-1-B-like [Lingula anatina]|uniref:Proteasome subunit beta n=1 Tax=Lingula anatina TaxID=7574 RepID=A0A1S3K4X0_LINAN|nr:proteasome subunit beta type-1-B-like [Lingula anatina]XP_013417311.1 proteasome subunit beta type-1-B-like [Lingula anatina]|eukprot:XP_013403439.1 proteasome subunit beta type-1-B-like [Lingula anatina]
MQMDPGLHKGEGYQYGPNPKQHYFSPYSMNGGTVLAIAGEDFAVVASDTRLSEGFSIHTRDSPKTYQLTNSTVLGCTGFHGDVLTVTKLLEARLKMYKNEHNRQMSTSAIAAMLSTVLYYRRFFPYYVYNIIGGLDDEGKGAVYSFDPIGSYEREAYRAGGTASSMLQPLLDNQIGFKNQEGVTKVPLSKEKAVFLVKDVFISAAERDIYTGDNIMIHVTTKDGTETEVFPLRRD